MTAVEEQLTRRGALEVLAEPLAGFDCVVMCNGYLSRDAFDAFGGAPYLYLIGSMGLAAAVALGVATSRPGARVCVVDGDANVLMGLAVLPMVGWTAPRRFLHVVVDNAANDSTGGQPTLSPTVDLPAMARAAGYRRARSCVSADEIKDFVPGDGPALLHVPVRRGGPVAARVPHPPATVAARVAERLR